MDQDHDCPSQFSNRKSMLKKIIYLNKKRKSHGDHFDLPLSKHKCFEGSGSYECESPLNQQRRPENGDLPAYVIYEHIEGETFSDGSGRHESVNDSNSFVKNCGSSVSVYGEEKSEPGFTNSLYSLDSRIVSNKIVRCEEYHDDLDDHLHEFEELTDCTSSVYEYDSFEHDHDSTLEDGSRAMTESVFVLSSERWTVKPETETGTKRPTIDQEFEQYFSSLML